MPLLVEKGAHIGGAIFIGDPHVSSRKPGTRNDEDFTAVVLSKMAQSIQIANAEDRIVVILGDLMDRDNDTDGPAGRRLLTRLCRVLASAKYVPVCLAGNHGWFDSKEGGVERATDATTLAALAAAGVIHLVDEAGFFLDVNTPDGRLIMGGSPHGHDIPADVTSLDGYAEGATAVWITHEDLAFEGAYPGALEFFEIKGCDMVVNGHMHLTKAPVPVGQTLWCNPGNITRQSKDCAEHVPSVWSMESTPSLKQIPLEYRKDVFDAVLNHVVAISAGAIPLSSSSFVEKLKQASTEDIKTQDGSLLLQDLQEVAADIQLSDGAREMLIQTFNETLHKMPASQP